MVPIEGLTLTEPWDLGLICLHTAASLDAVLASTATRHPRGSQCGSQSDGLGGADSGDVSDDAAG